MMLIFLCGMGILLCAICYLQLKWIKKGLQGASYRFLQLLLGVSGSILVYRFSGLFYRLQQESLRTVILFVSSVTLLWIIVFAILHLIAYLLWKCKGYKVSIKHVLCTCILLTALLTFTGYQQAAPLAMRSYTVPARMPLKKDLHFIFISDLHLGSGTDESRIDRLFAMIKQQPIDAVLMAGDIFDESTPNSILQYFCKKSQTAPFHDKIYYASGNHELLNKDRNSYENMMKESGIHIIEDACVKVDDRFYLIGRKDKKEERSTLASLLRSCKEKKPIIVLDHRPLFDEELKVDLQVSGHTHQGQIFPNTLFTKLAYPYDYGYYTKPYPMIVSSGAGTWGLPMRIGTTSEVVYITLKSQN